MHSHLYPNWPNGIQSFRRHVNTGSGKGLCFGMAPSDRRLCLCSALWGAVWIVPSPGLLSSPAAAAAAGLLRLFVLFSTLFAKELTSVDGSSCVFSIDADRMRPGGAMMSEVKTYFPSYFWDFFLFNSLCKPFFWNKKYSCSTLCRSM